MFKRWFEKKQEKGSPTVPTGLVGPRVPRHSSGWAFLRQRLQSESGLRIIDTGYTSPTNINYLTGLGHSVFMADPVAVAWSGEWQCGVGEDGKPAWDIAGFQAQALDFAGRTFDVVLLWTTLDYLPEPLVAPVVARLFAAMNPGGQVLALFHTRMQGEETANCRFHVTPGDDVEVQLAQPIPIQRAFANRSIEKLFAGWSGHKQFLAKDSVSEVIMTR